jgi:hypothetical protein
MTGLRVNCDGKGCGQIDVERSMNCKPCEMDYCENCVDIPGRKEERIS